MVHNQLAKFRTLLVGTALCGLVFFSSLKGAFAGEPGYIKLPDNKPFVFSAGIGYGVSNNLCKNCDDKSVTGGATFSFSLGYKINEKFRIEFGPAFWIEGNDLVNKNVADRERPNNKRTVVTFTGTCTPFNTVPLSFKLGGGAAVLNYTPDRTTVTTDAKTFDDTEIFKGFTGTFGLAYEFQLCPKIKLFPSLNLWYMQLEKPKIDYTSYIDYKKASVTTDFRINFNFNF